MPFWSKKSPWLKSSKYTLTQCLSMVGWRTEMYWCPRSPAWRVQRPCQGFGKTTSRGDPSGGWNMLKRLEEIQSGKRPNSSLDLRKCPFTYLNPSSSTWLRIEGERRTAKFSLIGKDDFIQVKPEVSASAQSPIMSLSHCSALYCLIVIWALADCFSIWDTQFGCCPRH
jgi:hypothetical protein